MVLTVHRWFANKSCPGSWLMARMDDLAAKVTAGLSGSDSTPATSSDTDNEKTIWNYLYGRLNNACAVAGIMGNLFAESGLKATNLQNSFEKKLGMDDLTYTAAVDSGAYGNFVKDSAGYGLAQWTYWSRKQALLDFAMAQKKSIGDLSMQLDFLWKELSESYKGLLSTLKATKSVREASDAVLKQYERPADQSEAVQKKRASYGQGYYDKYAASQAHTPSMPVELKVVVPFLVKVKISDLNIRKGAGTEFDRVSYITPGTYTIVKVLQGTGSKSGWGKLKSGVGYISLDHVVKV